MNSKLVLNENYGEITPALNRALKKYNVPPASYWELEDVYREQLQPVDHEQIRRFIVAHSTDGYYDRPWRLSHEQVLNA